MSGYNDYLPSRRETEGGCGLVAFSLVALAVLAVVLLVGSFLFSWFAVPFRVASPANVQNQWQFAYDYEEALKSSARNVCVAEDAEKNAPDANARLQRESQRIAQVNNYNRIQAEYDGRLRDAFRAKLVAPPDVPQRAPDLSENKLKVC